MLIDFLSGQNLPDVATRAGEEPLNSASQSETGDFGLEMDPDDDGSTEKKNLLVQTAQNALSVDGNDDKTTTWAHKRVRPRITTQSSAPVPKEPDKRSHGRLQNAQDRRTNGPAIKTENLDPALGGPRNSDHQQTLSPLDEVQRRDSSDTHGSSPLATSPRLRQFMASNGSETLPAIQSATPSTSAKSPTGQQSLPSISAQLGGLVDGSSPNEGLSSRSTFPMANGIQSPPMSGLSPRPNPYPSPQRRLNGFPTPYPMNQPSPASAFSEVSPREPYRMGQEATGMSPPGKPSHPYYTTGRGPQGEELTPQSAEGYSAFKGFATGMSPHGDHRSIEGGRILPPLPGTGSLSTGSFSCDFPGCNAAPFQTQYLLKYATTSDPPIFYRRCHAY